MSASTGRYHVTRTTTVPPEHRAVLARTTREHLHERLAELVAQGRVAVSVVAEQYHELMSQAGVATSEEESK